MKELDSFTVEEIEEIISSCRQEIHNTPTSDEFPVSPRLLLSLARIALAAKRAEPVGYLEQNHLDYLRSGSDADIWPDGGAGDIPVYLTPQLNYQVPLGSWIKCSDQMPESQQWGLVWAKWFNQQVLCWEDVGGQWTDFDGQSYSQDQITHWMPLPAAPEKENG
ncbi:DUF551 domain-containing protein [Yersinia enterocolitica]